MSFTDNLKKSLGFEEDDFGTAYGISDYGEEDFLKMSLLQSLQNKLFMKSF